MGRQVGSCCLAPLGGIPRRLLVKGAAVAGTGLGPVGHAEQAGAVAALSPLPALWAARMQAAAGLYNEPAETEHRGMG